MLYKSFVVFVFEAGDYLLLTVNNSMLFEKLHKRERKRETRIIITNFGFNSICDVWDMRLKAKLTFLRFFYNLLLLNRIQSHKLIDIRQMVQTKMNTTNQSVFFFFDFGNEVKLVLFNKASFFFSSQFYSIIFGFGYILFATVFLACNWECNPF